MAPRAKKGKKTKKRGKVSKRRRSARRAVKKEVVEGEHEPYTYQKVFRAGTTRS